jgi:hypothetical protein
MFFLCNVPEEKEKAEFPGQSHRPHQMGIPKPT